VSIIAGKIKGITITLGADVQPLNKALADVNKKSKDLQSELRQVDKLLKLNPKDTEMLSQKQKLLAEAVQNSKEKLDRLKTAQQQVNEQFAKGEISEEQYRAFQREVVKAEQELDGFEKQLKDTAAASKSFGDKMQAAGEKMQSVGANMTKYVTVPLAAAGAGMVAVGKTFDDAFDNIRIGTGATGKALEELNDDFRKVATQVPSSFDEVSTAIADYNTRLGISGQALQDLSVQTLNLARITEGDLGKIIEETSQAFQAFQVPTENYGDALDYVFKVAQSTGISIDRLEQNLVKFSPALKQMGFDFYDSAALMGFFDKAGVEVEQAMVGLNKALVTMAKKGVTDANEALQKLFDEIKNAPSDIKATELAIEIFGSKAGPLMASAIREGKLEYEALVQELMNSKETINGVADETDSWTEGLAKLKNQVMVAAEPIATTLFDALNKLVPLIEKAVPPLQKMADSFANMPQGLQVAIVAFAALLALMGPLLQGIGAIVIAAPGLAAAFTVMTGPIGLVVAAIGLLVAAIVLLYKQWKENGEKSKALLKEFSDNVKRIFEEVKTWLVNTWNSIKDFFKKWGDEILLIAVGPAGWAVLLGRKIAENWDSIKAKTSEVWNNIKTAITRPIESARDTVLNIIQRIKDTFANLKITIPKPKLPHIEVDWRSVGIGDARINIPKFSLNWYKTGGIFDRPSVIGVGEAGTEAVIPLDKMPGLIADALRDAMGGNQLAMAGGITVQNMYVRNDQDIKLVARELYNLQQTNARGRGLR
jgi:TP901 family phage tail tape measure protein